jgi:hypothetical protein
MNFVKVMDLSQEKKKTNSEPNTYLRPLISPKLAVLMATITLVGIGSPLTAPALSCGENKETMCHVTPNGNECEFA